jgi:hypothetical protein
MVKTTLLTLALLFGAVGATSAHATVGEPFSVGNKSPQELAEKVRTSLTTDSKGNQPVDEKCASNGYACATPGNYLQMFQRADPDAKLTQVSELPEYIEKLVQKDAPEGRYWMACLSKKKGHYPIWNCLNRPFHKGEHVWVNPRTGKYVLAEDCTNPLDGQDAPDEQCVELHIGMKKGDISHIAWLGRNPFPQGKCKASIIKTGDDERGSPVMDECPETACDFSADSKALGGMKVWKENRISWKADRDGIFILRLPREVLAKASPVLLENSFFVICLKRDNGYQTNALGILPQIYVEGRAYLGYAGTKFSAPNGRQGVAQSWTWWMP